MQTAEARRSAVDADGHSLRIRRHRGTVTGGRCPVINPPFSNALGALDQLLARFIPVLNDNDDSGVKLLLRVLDVGQAWPFRRDHVLDGYLRPVGLENRKAISIPPSRSEVSQNIEVGHFSRSDQAHEV